MEHVDAKVDAIQLNKLGALQYKKGDTVEVKCESESTTNPNEVEVERSQCNNMGGDSSDIKLESIEIKEEFICNASPNEDIQVLDNEQTGSCAVFSDHNCTCNQNLSVHINTQNKDHSFLCSICNLPANKHRSLRNHMCEHTLELGALQYVKADTVEVKIESDSTTNPDEAELRCNNIDGINMGDSSKITEDSVNASHGDISGPSNRTPDVSSTNEQTSHVVVNANDEKSFACSTCNYRTRNNSSMKRHLLVHSQEKPFSCSICNRRFRQKDVLKRHSLIHTKQKPFPCSVCEYKSNFKSSLKVHMLQHTQEKPFSCSACDFNCREKSKLKKHALIHTGVKPFACHACDYKCREKRRLKAHMELHNKWETSNYQVFQNLLNR